MSERVPFIWRDCMTRGQARCGKLRVELFQWTRQGVGAGPLGV